MVMLARIWILKSFGATVLWPSEHEASDMTGYNSGYWFLGTTLSVNHNYNGLLCVHYLLVVEQIYLWSLDMTDRCKSKNPDRRYWGSVNSGLHLSWWYGQVMEDGAILHS